MRAHGFRTWRTAATQQELATVVAQGALDEEAVTVRHTLLNPGTMAQLRDVAPKVIAWTVNDSRRARELMRLGVDGVNTDRPEVMRIVHHR